MDLVFKIPDKDSPGFLRRNREALRFAGGLKADPTEELLVDMVDFLAEYVEEPQERKEAIEALWDASENQFMELLNSLTGGVEEGEENPTE